MKCQVCHTKDKHKFGASILICDSCLAQKQLKHMLSQSKAQIQQMINDALIHGTNPLPPPQGIFGIPIQSTDEPLTVQKLFDALKDLPKKPEPLMLDSLFGNLPKYWNSVLDDIPPKHVNCKNTDMPMMTAKYAFDTFDSPFQLFLWIVSQPMRLHAGEVRRSCEREFGNTSPLLDNATLPLPI